jgi:photosystem II stability/assembly factor-like uncharacterized protein
MKKLILFELILLFLATTFQTDGTGGWVQQTLPVNDFINDIFFIDSLTGWVVTDGRTSTNDTGYIFKTINGGNNWIIQYNQPMKLSVVQFIDMNTGYVGGGSGSGTGKLFKTTDGGATWFNIGGGLLGLPLIEDLFFVNKDTGWASSSGIFGGLMKTTNGGNSWTLQLNDTFDSRKIFFLNRDTGWVACQNTKLYRTTNGGVNWNLQFTFSGGGIGDIYFFNQLTGIISSGRFYKTTDGGFNWTMSVSTSIGGKMTFVPGFVGWAGQDINRIAKTIDSGTTWFYQSSSVFNNYSVSGIDTLKAWAGGTGIVHATDGGGPPVGIHQIGSEVPSEYKLYQNYPNPFNPTTKISYELKVKKFIMLKVYDIMGKEITTLVNQKQNAGTYQVDFSGNGFSSGVYFYSLIADGNIIDTKKMILIK